jgi:hypothetical protein
MFKIAPGDLVSHYSEHLALIPSEPDFSGDEGSPVIGGISPRFTRRNDKLILYNCTKQTQAPVSQSGCEAYLCSEFG